MRWLPKYVLLSGLMLAVGCADPQRNRVPSAGPLTAQEAAALRQELAEEKAQVAALQEQVAQQRRLSAKDFAALVQAQRIELGRFTRGVDLNNDGYDDAVQVYVRPYDQQGDIIKAAGEMVVEVYDLAEAPPGRQIGRWVFSIEETAGLWLSGLGTNHFKMVLPWPTDAAPKHSKLTVVARFTDALTGKTLETQKAVAVTLPSE